MEISLKTAPFDRKSIFRNISVWKIAVTVKSFPVIMPPKIEPEIGIIIPAYLDIAPDFLTKKPQPFQMTCSHYSFIVNA